jgi:hypothetical protein
VQVLIAYRSANWFIVVVEKNLNYPLDMNMAEVIYQKTKQLPESTQATILRMVEEMLQTNLRNDQVALPLTLRESAELRGKLAAWEEEWNAPEMEIYDRQ